MSRPFLKCVLALMLMVATGTSFIFAQVPQSSYYYPQHSPGPMSGSAWTPLFDYSGQPTTNLGAQSSSVQWKYTPVVTYQPYTVLDIGTGRTAVVYRSVTTWQWTQQSIALRPQSNPVEREVYGQLTRPEPVTGRASTPYSNQDGTSSSLMERFAILREQFDDMQRHYQGHLRRYEDYKGKLSTSETKHIEELEIQRRQIQDELTELRLRINQIEYRRSER